MHLKCTMVDHTLGVTANSFTIAARFPHKYITGCTYSMYNDSAEIAYTPPMIVINP